MAYSVSSLDWEPTTAGGTDRVAVVNCDGSINADWVIQIQGTDVNGQPVIAKYAIVDNVPNNGIVTVNYGPFSFTIPPFTRRTFQLPNLIFTFEVLVNVGAARVTFTENATSVPDEQNQQAAAASVANNLFPVIAVTASRGQVVGDLGSQIIFSSAVQINYALLGASSVPNGAYCPVLTNKGSANVVITPNGTDTINGIYTTATPLAIAPGDTIQLGSDGGTWWAEGEVSWESGEFAANTQAVSAVAHPLAQKPKRFEIFIRNKIADIGYTPGDEIPFATLSANGQNSTQQHIAAIFSAANLTFVRGAWNGSATFSNKSTGNDAIMTLANWAFFVRGWIKL